MYPLFSSSSSFESLLFICLQVSRPSLVEQVEEVKIILEYYFYAVSQHQIFLYKVSRPLKTPNIPFSRPVKTHETLTVHEPGNWETRRQTIERIIDHTSGITATANHSRFSTVHDHFLLQIPIFCKQLLLSFVIFVVIVVHLQEIWRTRLLMIYKSFSILLFFFDF